MANKYLIIYGEEQEIDQLEEYVLDYQQSTRELSNIKVLGNDLFKEYWKMELSDIEDQIDCELTNENIDSIIDEFKKDDISWSEINEAIGSFYYEINKKIKNGEMEW